MSGENAVNRSFGLCAVLLFCSFAAFAETRTWKTTPVDSNWKNGNNYDGGVAPHANDLVIVPAGTDVMVQDVASFELASSLKGIQLTDAASRVVFVINENDEGMDGVDFLAPICSNVASPRNSDYKIGAIVKRGTGVRQ